MVYMGVMVDVRIVTDIKNQKEQNNIILICLIIHYIPMALPKEFCIAECKTCWYFLL